MKLSNELILALNSIFKAGESIMQIYESDDFSIELKSDNSPLTKADKAAHEIIKSYLKKTKIPLLSEEGKEIPYSVRKHWKRFWLVDPIDGTKEFIKQNGEFTVNIAIIEDGKPILGVVYAPSMKDLYFAERGLGSFKVENVTCFNEFEKAKMIDLSKSIYPEVYTLVVSKSHMNEETQKFVDSKKEEYGEIAAASFGSSLKICKIAEGTANCYPRFGPTMEWDTAAAHAVAIYAGNKVTQSDTISLISYNKENLLNPYFIISNED